MPVYEVALLCGYDNVAHFIRQFKDKTGYSPSSYRKKIAANDLNVLTHKCL